jgi:hypothetical protein
MWDVTTKLETTAEEARMGDRRTQTITFFSSVSTKVRPTADFADELRISSGQPTKGGEFGWNEDEEGRGGKVGRSPPLLRR